MKLVLFSLALLMFSLAPLSAEPNIPGSLWEQHPEGIALAVTLTTRTEKGQPISSIQLYIKNTSKTDRYFAGIAGGDTEFKIFYMKDHDVQIPLRNYDSPEAREIMKNVDPVEIKPGETLSRAVDLTPDELALIKGHPVKCRIDILDEKNKHYVIESSPKILIGGP